MGGATNNVSVSRMPSYTYAITIEEPLSDNQKTDIDNILNKLRDEFDLDRQQPGFLLVLSFSETDMFITCSNVMMAEAIGESIALYLATGEVPVIEQSDLARETAH